MAEPSNPSVRVTIEARRLARPFRHPGVVLRRGILDRLEQAGRWTVLSVVGSAGWGKSILLSQWAEEQEGPTAWVALDRDDDDPTVLLMYLATALDDVVGVDPDLFDQITVEFPPTGRIARRLANLLTRADHPFQLVLDDVHKVSNPLCLDVVDLLVRQATPTAQVALGSREEIGHALPRLRGQGSLVEVGQADLAMGPDEAREMVTGVGAELSPDDLSALVVATDGWPVALYLAAHSVQERAPLDITALGRHPDIAAYVHAELMASLDADTEDFLLRSSVLERMSGPSCDAVLHTFGSQQRLESAVESNLLVRRFGDDGTWFRYHDLFRDLLRAELERREPDAVPELLRRAGHWYQTHGLLDEAVDYAMAAGDTDRAAALVTAVTIPTYESGRSTTLEGWLDWFEDHGRLEEYPTVALAGAWVAALDGHAAVAERRAAAADRARPRARLRGDEGDHVDGQVALLHALLCRDGVDEAALDAAQAARLLPADHPWFPTMLVVRGLLQVAKGATDDATTTLIEASSACEAADAWPAQSVALAQRAVLAMQRRDRRRARQLCRQALAVVDEHGLHDHVPSTLAFAVGARFAGRDGDPDRARELLTSAQRLRPRLTHAIPHLAVQARLELVRTLLALSDVAGARTMLRETHDILQLRPDLGHLVQEVEELHSRVAALPPGRVGAQSLTTAELRLLPLLQTHLTFRQIGERLYLSPNTVKTQAISVYRKLGVSSRSGAVDVAVQSGLLEAF